MANIINTQTNAKTFLRILIMISSIALVLSITLSSAYAMPPHWGFNNNNNCKDDQSKTLYQKTCCWYENVEPGTGNPDIGGNQEKYCQTCSEVWQNGAWTWDCDAPELQFRIAPTTDDDVPTFELTPTENEPPIKSDESVFPNDNSDVLDEQQPTNPTFDSNKGTIHQENLAQDQPMQFSSTDEENQELTETNDADTTANNQENDDLSTFERTSSEMTTSFAKKGDIQNSPVPPECPKQGPIPPDCTMKPKF